MPIFDLTVGKIIYLIESINRFLFQAPIEALKAFEFFISIIVSILMLIFWLKIEKISKEETNFFKALIKNWKDFEFLKKPKRTFEEIKKIFYQNKNKALIEINNFFDFVLSVFGYDGTLEEKLNKISVEILPNLDEVKKAYKIVEIIEEKLKKNEKINLTEDEYLIIFHEYEKALYNLNILTIEDFLVKNQE